MYGTYYTYCNYKVFSMYTLYNTHRLSKDLQRDLFGVIQQVGESLTLLGDRPVVGVVDAHDRPEEGTS